MNGRLLGGAGRGRRRGFVRLRGRPGRNGGRHPERSEGSHPVQCYADLRGWGALAASGQRSSSRFGRGSMDEILRRCAPQDDGNGNSNGNGGGNAPRVQQWRRAYFFVAVNSLVTLPPASRNWITGSPSALTRATRRSWPAESFKRSEADLSGARPR